MHQIISRVQFTKCTVKLERTFHTGRNKDQVQLQRAKGSLQAPVDAEQDLEGKEADKDGEPASLDGKKR